MQKIYIFQWPSNIGGADTRLKELIQLFNLNKNIKLFCIPNDDERFQELDNINFLKENNVEYLSWNDLPQKTDGIALSFCNSRLFTEKWRIEKIKSMGLKFVWSNDMTWRIKEELECVDKNLVDATIYTNKQHYSIISNHITKKIKEFIIPNYFHIENYNPILKIEKDTFTIGKHSRTDMLKFSNDFPFFYENLNIENPKYRVMGINHTFKRRFQSFNFSDKWDLLKVGSENTNDFLSSLDCYVYNAHHTFIETHCRATVEAMLMEIPVIAPNKINFSNQIWHSKSGFLWNNYEECQNHCKYLEKNFNARKYIGKFGRQISKFLWCDKERHQYLWNQLFNQL